MDNKKTVLVTGGAGFIGSHLVRRLVRDGYKVVVLTRETTNTHRLKDVIEQVTIIRDDLSNPERLTKLMEEVRPHGVMHLAASTIKQGVTAPEDDLMNANVLGIIHLIKALSRVEYEFFINTGSYLEYGTKENPFKESDSCNPLEIYALSKLTATLYAQSVAKASGKPIITFRIFSPYGPDMEKGRLFYEVVRRALAGEEISLTSPEIKRDFIFVDDIVELYMEAIEKAKHSRGEIFNLGAGNARSLKELVDTARAHVASKSEVKWDPSRMLSYDAGCQEANMEKTFSTFTWRPTHNLEAGVTRMSEWCKSLSS